MFVNMTKPPIPPGLGVLGIPVKGNSRLPYRLYYSACKARIRSSLMMVQKTYRHVPSNLLDVQIPAVTAMSLVSVVSPICQWWSLPLYIFLRCEHCQLDRAHYNSSEALNVKWNKHHKVTYNNIIKIFWANQEESLGILTHWLRWEMLLPGKIASFISGQSVSKCLKVRRRWLRERLQ